MALALGDAVSFLSNLAPGAGATIVIGVGTGTTGAVSASLAATAGVTNWLTGFDVSAIGGTATIGPITVATLIGSKTLTYQLASTASGNTLSVRFDPPLPASAQNAAITVTTTADGTATAVDVNVYGFQE